MSQQIALLALALAAAPAAAAGGVRASTLSALLPGAPQSGTVLNGTAVQWLYFRVNLTRTDTLVPQRRPWSVVLSPTGGNPDVYVRLGDSGPVSTATFFC